MRVLVTGSRYHPESFIERVHAVLFPLFHVFSEGGEKITFIHGDNPRGVDAMVKKIAEELGANEWAIPAEWDFFRSLGKPKAAGAIRNLEMVEELQPDMVIAFPHSNGRGTQDCIEAARRAGIITVIYGP